LVLYLKWFRFDLPKTFPMKKIILTSFAILSCITAFSQSGQKWASGGNSLSTGEFFGSTNNFPLVFKVNNIQKMSLATTVEFPSKQTPLFRTKQTPHFEPLFFG
jgi:hypothetical protein